MPSSYTTDLPNDILIDSAVLYYNGGDGAFTIAGLAKDTVPEEFKTTATARYQIGGVNYSKDPTTGISFSSAHVVSTSKYGIILVQVNAAGTISTKVPASPQAYNSAALALAAKPAVDSGNAELGYLIIANSGGGAWTAGTDDLTDGSDLTSATFTDTLTSMTKFGATRGGLTFKKGIDWRNVPYDGASGKTAGLDRKIDGTPTIEGTVLLLNPLKATVFEPGATTASVGTNPNATMTITPLPFRSMLPAAGLHRYECLWKRGNGGTVKVIFPLGLAIMETLQSQDNNEGELPIVVEARNDPDDIDGVDEVPIPYYIEITGSDIPSA